MQCGECGARFSDLPSALARPPASPDGEVLRLSTCPCCNHSVPPKADHEQLAAHRGDLPVTALHLLREDSTAPVRKTTEVMFVDLKNGESPRIMRVAVSKSGRTVYVDGRGFERIGSGYKYNFVASDDRSAAWISRPRRDGLDALYPEVVMVDDDVRDEYWNQIRGTHDQAGQRQFRSPGKYTKRGRGKRQSGPEMG